MVDTIVENIQAKLTALYGVDQSKPLLDRILALIPQKTGHERDIPSVSEHDVMLIAYGDHIRRPGEPPLRTLGAFLDRYTDGLIPCVHLLPFYPFTSDDGFSVVDYYAINPALGTWDDVRALGQKYRLMYDAVFNHISSKSRWFEGFKQQISPYSDYFVVVDPDVDLSQVVRPRTLPLLTPVETSSGIKHVWTTFSADQIDLNVMNPEVLLELLKALLFYVQQGAQFIRLDAIAFMWKEVGTSCIHLPQTHLIIQLMRDVLDLCAPDTILITETNVPHQENVSYFGDGTNEAQMVYNFALPPLIYHTMLTGDATALSGWAAALKRPGEQATFFNFTASHDGIGVRPITAILSDEQIGHLVAETERHGGFVSYRSMPDGSQSPYELNITYFDAITDPAISEANPDLAVRRFLVSQAIALAFMGMPAIYFHSLVGSRNDLAGVQETGQKRSINRAKLDFARTAEELEDSDSLRAKVLRSMLELIRLRAGNAAFHPLASQIIHHLHPGVFALERLARNGADRVIALHNVTEDPVRVSLGAFGPLRWQHMIRPDSSLVSSEITLEPLEIAWLKPSS